MRICRARFEWRLRVSARESGEVPRERIVDAIIGTAGRDGLEGGPEPARWDDRPHGIPDTVAVHSDAAVPMAGDKRRAGASERRQIGPTGRRIDIPRRRETVQGGRPIPALAVPNPPPRTTGRKPSPPGTGRINSADGSEVTQ